MAPNGPEYLFLRAGAVGSLREPYGMAITSTSSVRIDKPQDVSTGEMINRIHDWLNANQIEARRFQADVQTNGTVAFDVTFASVEQATLFNSEFG
jgi:hypothetical protein